jgi:hypothetical protein
LTRHATSSGEMEAAAQDYVAVTPVLQHRHPGHPKFWARIAGAGTLTESYNMTSVTDTGTGDNDGTIATDFTTATYGIWCDIVTGSWDTTNVFVNQFVSVNAQAAGTFGLQCVNFSTSTTAASTAVALADPSTSYSCFGLGDQ